MERLQRSGFTLVELLVTLGVIGLLLSLLLAGIQSARSAARRTQCLNNIRQLALATHEFESAHGRLPQTRNETSYPGGVSRSISPHVFLLPYLEQGALYDSIDLAEPSSGVFSEPPASTLNPQALTTAVPTFVCPDDGLAIAGSTSYRACVGIGPRTIGSPGEPGYNSGAFRAHYDGSHVAEIRDGMSNTVLFGEKLTGDRDPSRFTPWRDAAEVPIEIFTLADAEAVCAAVGTEPKNHYSFHGAAWLLGGPEHTWYNHVLPPNSTVPDCYSGGKAIAARSFHAGGVNVALADGAGRFVSESIDVSLWRAVATRSLGETAGGW